MNEFSKLNRDQMRKITGGEPQVCIYQGCSYRYSENPNDPNYDPNYQPGTVLLGICREEPAVGCACFREYVYVYTSQCFEVS